MAYHRTDEETLARDALAALQRQKLAALLGAVRESNPFYRRKLGGIVFDPQLDPIQKLPLTTRAEIEADQRENPPFGTNLTFPVERYCRFHQTSGTSGQPVRWLDTAESWDWWKQCWATVFRGAGLAAGDRVVFPFSFGPFIGFWSAFESAVMLGNLCLPAGGMTTAARLRYLIDNRVTFVCCTPTYALHMAAVAAGDGIDLSAADVRVLVLAGEPGGSIAATRARIESAWSARVCDHAGMTEIGAWGFECEEQRTGMHIIESEFIPEVIDPETLEPAPDGERGELVLTNLGRIGSPLIRYRTGDLVQLSLERCACGRGFVRAVGGVLGRIDEMVTVRGNNVFPAAIEGIVRSFEAVAEYRVIVDESPALTVLRIEIEPAPGADGTGLAARVAARLRDTCHFRPDVELVGAGSLPRYELKARRFVRRRN